MKLLSEISIKGAMRTSLIQLLQGDLSAIPPEHETDILVMSAFPGDYVSLKGSLIDALAQKGLSVPALAKDIDTDLRKQLSCWMSKPLSAAERAKFNFSRILCFEPGESIHEPEKVVGNVFRCINSFAFDDDNNVVSMPIIATGYQRVPIQKILPALLKAAVFWLQNGLPLDSLKLVVYRNQHALEAEPVFEAFKKELETGPELQAAQQAQIPGAVAAPPAPAAAPEKQGYDYFLSYSHAHAADIRLFVDVLKKCNRSLSVFYDKDSIAPGGQWLQEISKAIQQSEKVLVFLSPDYDNSPVCWDEFQCAKLMEYNRKRSVIQTVYLYGYKEREMPLIMGIYNYIDCREGSSEKLHACVQQLLK